MGQLRRKFGMPVVAGSLCLALLCHSAANEEDWCRGLDRSNADGLSRSR